MKIKSIIKYVNLFAALVFLSGCATIISGTTQDIHINAIDVTNGQDLPHVICSVTDGSGSNYVVPGNPGIIKVKRGNGSLLVTCKKPGYKQLNMAVGDDFNAVTIANVLFWPGMIVDLASGAYKKYPSHYVVSMEKI